MSCATRVDKRDEDGNLIGVDHGPDCHYLRLHEALSGPLGELLRRGSELERILESHITLSADDIGCLEYKALCVIKAERARYVPKPKDQEHDG